MDTLQLALNEVRRQISQLQPYLSQLQAVETELSALLESRQDVVRELMVKEEESIPSVPSSSPTISSHHSNDHPSIPNTIITILDMAKGVMKLWEIDREVRKIHKDIHKNAVSNAVSRMVKDKRIQKIRAGEYAAFGVYSVTGKTPGLVRISAPGQDSTPMIAQRILREAGQPRTIDEIWPLAKAVKPNLKRHSFVGSLYGNAKINRFFILVAPKTFGLLEWENRKVENQATSTDTNISEATEDIRLEETQERESVEEGLELVHQTE